MTIAPGFIRLVECVPRHTIATTPWAESPSDQAMDVEHLPSHLAAQPEAVLHRDDPEAAGHYLAPMRPTLQHHIANDLAIEM